MDSPKVLKRKITSELRESRERDIETVLDNYRDNLRDHGVTDKSKIESFVAGEQEKMHKEYESLDRGETSSNIYHTPNNWNEIAAKMKSESPGLEETDEEEMSMQASPFMQDTQAVNECPVLFHKRSCRTRSTKAMPCCRKPSARTS